MALTNEMLKSAHDAALKKITKNMAKYPLDFPTSAAEGGKYGHSENHGWTISFWTGMLWLAYELTGEEKYKACAMAHMPSYRERYDKRYCLDDHDIGFIYTLASTAGYKITGDEVLRKLSLDAASLLAARFREKGQFIQLASDENGPKEYYRLIIDCLMNIHLLYWAGEQTGNKEYTRKAYAHFCTTMETVIRDDGSTFQNFYFDPATGARLGGGTKQGFSDNSCWSRGQSWGVLGIPLTYDRMKNDDIIDTYYKVADYYLDHLPQDKVAFWDLCFTDGDKEPRDSSAAAIGVCGLLEACRVMPLDESHRERYKKAAEDIMESLIASYTTKDDPESDGILAHGTYYYAGGLGIDECNIWGDYFFVEALTRFLKPDWKKYW